MRVREAETSAPTGRASLPTSLNAVNRGLITYMQVRRTFKQRKLARGESERDAASVVARVGSALAARSAS